MPIRRTTACALLLLALLTACRIERTPRAGLADPLGVARAEIYTMLDDYQRALLEGNARRTAAFFTTTARLYLPDRPDIQGRGEIDAAFAALFEEATVARIEMQSEEIDVAAATAYQFGSFRQRLRDDDGAEQEIGGRFAIRWTRGPESTWQIERMLINHYPVDPAAVAAR